MRIRLTKLICPGRGTRAFSLPEVAVAMGVVGICAMALLTGLTTSMFTMRLTRENLRATQVMLEKAETLRLYNWDQINTTNYIPTSFQAPYDPANTNAQGITYYGGMWIFNSPLDTSYRSEMREVMVYIYWYSGNLWRSRWLVTYVTRNGLQCYVY